VNYSFDRHNFVYSMERGKGQGGPLKMCWKGENTDAGNSKKNKRVYPEEIRVVNEGASGFF